VSLSKESLHTKVTESRKRGVDIKRYINSSVYFTYLLTYTAARHVAGVSERWTCSHSDCSEAARYLPRTRGAGLKCL